MNRLLQEQLDQMKCSNQRLAGELERATSDLHRLRGKLEQRESQQGSDGEVSPSTGPCGLVFIIDFS